MNVISTLIKETSEISLALFLPVRTQQEDSHLCMKQEAGLHHTLNLPVP